MGSFIQLVANKVSYVDNYEEKSDFEQEHTKYEPFFTENKILLFNEDFSFGSCMTVNIDKYLDGFSSMFLRIKKPVLNLKYDNVDNSRMVDHLLKCGFNTSADKSAIEFVCEKIECYELANILLKTVFDTTYQNLSTDFIINSLTNMNLNEYVKIINHYNSMSLQDPTKYVINKSQIFTTKIKIVKSILFNIKNKKLQNSLKLFFDSILYQNNGIEEYIKNKLLNKSYKYDTDFYDLVKDYCDSNHTKLYEHIYINYNLSNYKITNDLQTNEHVLVFNNSNWQLYKDDYTNNTFTKNFTNFINSIQGQYDLEYLKSKMDMYLCNNAKKNGIKINIKVYCLNYLPIFILEQIKNDIMILLNNSIHQVNELETVTNVINSYFKDYVNSIYESSILDNILDAVYDEKLVYILNFDTINNIERISSILANYTINDSIDKEINKIVYNRTNYITMCINKLKHDNNNISNYSIDDINEYEKIVQFVYENKENIVNLLNIKNENSDEYIKNILNDDYNLFVENYNKYCIDNFDNSVSSNIVKTITSKIKKSRLKNILLGDYCNLIIKYIFIEIYNMITDSKDNSVFTDNCDFTNTHNTNNCDSLLHKNVQLINLLKEKKELFTRIMNNEQPKYKWLKNGSELISSVDLYVGNVLVDSIDGLYIMIDNMLNLSYQNYQNFKKMTNFSSDTVYIPLNFPFFKKNRAFSYTNIEHSTNIYIRFTIKPLHQLIKCDDFVTIPYNYDIKADILCNYIMSNSLKNTVYNINIKNKLFKSSETITAMQSWTQRETTNKYIKYYITGVIKNIIIVIKYENKNPVKSVTILLNDTIIENTKNIEYYKDAQTYEHFYGSNQTKNMDVLTYSFGLGNDNTINTGELYLNSINYITVGYHFKKNFLPVEITLYANQV